MKVVTSLVVDEEDLRRVTQWLDHLATDKRNMESVSRKIDEAVIALCNNAFKFGLANTKANAAG